MLGSHWVMGSLALCSANIQFPGNQLLLQLLKPGWQVFRPGCSRWNFVSLWEAPAIIWGLQGTRHLASVDREMVKLMESKQSSPSSGPQDWFTAQPVNIQATHPCSELNLLALKSALWRTSASFPRPKPPTQNSKSIQIGGKTLMQVLYPLSTVVSSSGSCFPTSQSTDERTYSPSSLSSPFPLSSRCKSSTLAATSPLETTWGPACLAKLPQYIEGLDVTCLDHIPFDVGCWSEDRKSNYDLL